MNKISPNHLEPGSIPPRKDPSQAVSAHPKWVTNLLIRATNLSKRISSIDNDTVKNDTEISVLEKHSQALDATKYNIFALLWHAACLHFICQSTERLADKYKQNAQTFKERFEKLPAAIKDSITAHCPEWLKNGLNDDENTMMSDRQFKKITELTDKMEKVCDPVFDCWALQPKIRDNNEKIIENMLTLPNIFYLPTCIKNGQVHASKEETKAVSVDNLQIKIGTISCEINGKSRNNNDKKIARYVHYLISNFCLGIANYNGARSVVLTCPKGNFRLIIPIPNNKNDLSEAQQTALDAVNKWADDFPKSDVLQNFASQWENLDKN